MRRVDELYTAWPFPRLAADDGAAAGRGAKRVQPQARAATDAADGHRRLGAEATHDKTRAGATRSSPISAQPGDRAGRIHVWAADITYVPDRAGISLHGGDHRLGEPCGAGLAAVEHDGCRVLPCGAPEEALARFGKPEDPSTPETRAANSPAGTSPACWRRPASASRWTGGAAGCDNVFIEPAVAQPEIRGRIYLKGYADGREARSRDRRMAGFFTP